MSEPRYEREDDAEAVTEVRRTSAGPPRPPPPGWRERWWIGGIVLLLLVGGLIAFFVLRDRGNETASGTATVPNVVGLREADAIRRVDDAGLDADVQRTASDRPEGTVIDQNPGAGTRLSGGDRVVVVVAVQATTVTQTVTKTETAPPEQVAVPDVVGQDHVQAGSEVDAAGLVANTYPVPSDEVQGTVLAQNPDAGTKVVKGSPVRLNVALGAGKRGTATVPDLTGADPATARDRCRKAGFTCLTVQRAARSGEQAGTVVSQRPAAGATLARLTQLTLFVTP
jgi:serine/threonine-protein kinase